MFSQDQVDEGQAHLQNIANSVAGRLEQAQADRTRNCKVSINGFERGQNFVDINAGAVNDFGLVHVFGNAQEIVLNPQQQSAEEYSYEARGGAYRDEIERCGVALVKSVKPNGDKFTGFRLVRELS